MKQKKMGSAMIWPVLREKLQANERDIFLHAEGMLLAAADMFEELHLTSATYATRKLAETAVKELSTNFSSRKN